MQLSDTTKQFDDFFQENADFFQVGFRISSPQRISLHISNHLMTIDVLESSSLSVKLIFTRLSVDFRFFCLILQRISDSDVGGLQNSLISPLLLI
jgi:hypothetical protein